MKFALFFMAEYIKMIAVSAIAATLFFGGYVGIDLSFIPVIGPIINPGWDRLAAHQGNPAALRDDLDPRHPAAHPL